MILGYRIQNYRSFREPADVSFLATARRDEPDLRFPVAGTRHGVLPVLGAWGANASGKSNLLDALLELRSMVELSFTGLGPDDELPWTPWRLDRDGPPTEIELEFTVPAGDADAPPVRHQLVVAWRDTGIVHEALYAWPLRSRRTLYERDAEEDEPFRPGSTLRRAREVWRATRPNALYLSTAAQLDHDDLLPVWRAVVQGIAHVQPDRWLPGTGRTLSLFGQEEPIVGQERRELFLRMLQAADLSVSGLDPRPREDIKRQAVEAYRSVPALRDSARAIDQEPPPVELRLVHGEGEQRWSCPSELESAGTRKLLYLFNALVPVLENGTTCVVDELDRSLHPDLCREVIGLFTNPETNPKGAQLLFTTHSRDLLEALRTDEVLLLDREADGASRLLAASDIRGLRTRDDLARAHRQGRIGAVPLIAGLGAAFLAGTWAATRQQQEE